MTKFEQALSFAQQNSEYFLRGSSENGDQIIVNLDSQGFGFYKWNNEILRYSDLIKRMAETRGVRQ